MSFDYFIEGCGRVKMSGGSFSTYYDLASALIGKENPGATEIIETNNNFKNIRKQPPFDLLLAFFPDDAENIQYRLRGAGAYRHLRMDQGPGGNFTRFDIGVGNKLHYDLLKDKGFALPEVLISEQLAGGKSPRLSALAAEVQDAFEKNDYRKTAALANKFRFEAEVAGIKLHDGEHVGSKSGFFFIRPAAAERAVEFPLAKLPQLREKIDEALNKTLSLAEYTRRNIKEGMSFDAAAAKARQEYAEQGGISYSEKGLLYFQPDCFVDNQGNIEVEKVNMPDVGMFMTMLNRLSNPYLQKVVAANLDLKDRLKNTAGKFLEKESITLLTRDEVLNYHSDSLELLEIQALKKMLESIGKKVNIRALSGAEAIGRNEEVLLLNVDAQDRHFGKFAERAVKEDICCYADPLAYYFKDHATTLKTMQVPAKNMEQFLQLIKPKDINAKNSENIYNRLQYIMKRFDMNEDILYANVSGCKMPIPVFKYSLHSFGQIYKAYEKNNDKDAQISLSAVPVNRDNAVFYGNGKPRLSAFRFMCTKER